MSDVTEERRGGRVGKSGPLVMRRVLRRVSEALSADGGLILAAAVVLDFLPVVGASLAMTALYYTVPQPLMQAANAGLMILFIAIKSGVITALVVGRRRGLKAPLAWSLGATRRAFPALLLITVAVAGVPLALNVAVPEGAGGGRTAILALAGWVQIVLQVFTAAAVGVAIDRAANAGPGQGGGFTAPLVQGWALTSGNRWRIFGLYALWVFPGAIVAAVVAALFRNRLVADTFSLEVLVKSALLSLVRAGIVLTSAAAYLELVRARGGAGPAEVAEVFD